jgi:eukaryotic-like serine/threonine-protein kinase
LTAVFVSEGVGRFVGDRYHIVRELGRGGMGVVYLGRDLRRDMDVAIKFRSLTHHDATLWLKREFRSVATLRHPNLVELYELVAHEQSCYFTMEYLPGVDPRLWVHKPRRREHDRSVIASEPTGHAVPLPEARTEMTLGHADATAAPAVVPEVDFSRVRGVLAQLAEGLAFLHARGVIHRDVKPSNVLVGPGDRSESGRLQLGPGDRRESGRLQLGPGDQRESGRPELGDGAVKLLDFGLALDRRRAEEEVARETRIVGTAAYLAPEYVERLDVSPAMDVYSLGVLAFELVTGAPPFGGTLHVLSRLRRKMALPRAIDINPDVPHDLDELIDQMLAADPLRRPTALEVAIQLTGALSTPRPVRRVAQFVGRERELALLEARIADVRPQSRLVLVTGASGAGKTSLVEEALSRARIVTDDVIQALAWRGRCHERERVPYRAFDFIIDDLANELAAVPSLASGIEHVAALGRVFPSLGAALDLDVDDAPAAGDRRVDSGGQSESGRLQLWRERALIAMTQLFQHVVATRGVIVIDDLQWADEDSLELMALLVERVKRPLTIIATWTVHAELPHAVRALLERLGGAAERLDVPEMSSGELVELMTTVAPNVPTDRLHAAARQAAGNPYLAELIGRELAEADGHTDLHRAELRRLERLGPAERTVAELVALAVGVATFEQLRGLAELPSAQLSSALRGLEDGRVIKATPSASGEPVYTFYHQRLRDAAHDALDPDARRGLHVRFAEWLERDGADADQLAFHHEQGANRERAAHWSIVAADAARAQLAWAVAADWYGRAVALGARSRRADQADCLFLGGKLAAAAAEFETLAMESARGDRWRVRAAESYIKLGEIERGLAILDGVLARNGEPRAKGRVTSALRAVGVAARWLVPAPARKPVDDVVVAAYRVIASFLSTPYPIESFEYVLRGIQIAERAGDHDAHGLGMAMLAGYLAAGSLGRFGDRALAAAHRVSARSASPYPRMVAAGTTGLMATVRGDWPAMRAAHAEAQRICEKLGLERSWEASFLRTYQALGEMYAGEPKAALQILDELTDASDDMISRAMLGSYRGRALVLAGDLAAARALERELDRQPAARRGMASIYRQVFAGELALAERDWGRAEAIGNELARATRSQWLQAMPAVSALVDTLLATAELGKRDRASAQRARARSRALYRRARSSFYAATALRLWGQAERALGNHAEARRVLAHAAAVAVERGGNVDRLALARLTGAAVDCENLAFAVMWNTGGAVDATAPTASTSRDGAVES